jgi:hypothetical protein
VKLVSDTLSIEFHDRIEVSSDHFLLLQQREERDNENIKGLATIICKSWKVCMDDGSLKLPMPRDEYLKLAIARNN